MKLKMIWFNDIDNVLTFLYEILILQKFLKTQFNDRQQKISHLFYIIKILKKRFILIILIIL